jgi:hypothetical protein
MSNEITVNNYFIFYSPTMWKNKCLEISSHPMIGINFSVMSVGLQQQSKKVDGLMYIAYDTH